MFVIVQSFYGTNGKLISRPVRGLYVSDETANRRAASLNSTHGPRQHYTVRFATAEEIARFA